MADNGTTGEARRAKAAGDGDNLEAQIAQLQADIRNITETLGRMGADRLDDAKAGATSKAKRALADAQSEFETLETQLKDTVRNKPLTAIAAALAIGYVLAALTR